VSYFSIPLKKRTNKSILSSLTRNQARTKKYAQLHNYSYYDFSNTPIDNDISPYWVKIYLMLKLMTEECNFEYLFWLDSDAVILNTTRKIEHIISDFDIDTNVSLVFSGDTNIINSGVLLMKNSEWSKYALNELYHIGFVNNLGVEDNGAFSVFLMGCTHLSTQVEYRSCYDKADRGWRGPEKKVYHNYHLNANRSYIDEIVSEPIRNYVRVIPHTEFNSMSINGARFIRHFAGKPLEEKADEMTILLNHLQ